MADEDIKVILRMVDCCNTCKYGWCAFVWPFETHCKFLDDPVPTNMICNKYERSYDFNIRPDIQWALRNN